MKEMPLQSVLRILGKMTSKKILEPGGSETQAVCDRIQSESALKKVGPVSLSYLSRASKHQTVFEYLTFVLKSPGQDSPFQYTLGFRELQERPRLPG